MCGAKSIPRRKLFIRIMAKSCFDSWIVLLMATLPYVLTQSTDTRVFVKVPMNSIREGGVLAIHCNIEHLNEDDHHVKVLRELYSGTTQVISYNELIVAPEFERAFIAKRTLFDGSVVYFLSIINVDRRDSGTYTCKVTRSSDDVVVAQASTMAHVQYFPGEENPKCHPGSPAPLRVKAGRPLRLNCSSEIGNPPVLIHWSNTGAGALPKDISVAQDTVSYSELILFPTKTDDNTLFLCTITSEAFPGRESSCHIGPVIVIDNDPLDELETLYTPAPATTSRIPHKSTDDNVLSGADTSDSTTHESKCSCDNTEWMIITYSVSSLALVLLILSLIMLCVYRSAMNRSRSKNRMMTTYRMPDDMYSNVRERNQHLYMSLDRKMAIARPTTGQSQLPKLETGFT